MTAVVASFYFEINNVLKPKGNVASLKASFGLNTLSGISE